MSSEELLIRIDERQKQQGDDIKEILEQVKSTNGRVSKLETYKEMDESRDIENTKTLDNHEKRLDSIEKVEGKISIVDDVAKRIKEVEDIQKAWKIRLGTITVLVSGAVVVVELIIKFVFR